MHIHLNYTRGRLTALWSYTITKTPYMHKNTHHCLAVLCDMNFMCGIAQM